MTHDDIKEADIGRLSLLSPCTCMRDGKPCRACRLWDRYMQWLDVRPTGADAKDQPPSCSTRA